MKKNFANISIALACVMVLASASSSHAAFPRTADGYPSKPIVNILPYPAGGGLDISLRLIASFIPKYLGQPMVVDNQPGGSSVPGTLATGKANPDGYTIGTSTYSLFTIRPFVLTLPYTQDDFSYIIGMFDQRQVLAVRTDAPFKTFEDLIKHAKANDGKLNYTGGGNSSLQHILGEWLGLKAGFKAEFIPYDGARPSAVALLGGRVDYAILALENVKPELEAGSFRLLACFQNERLMEAPNVPTIAELGYGEVMMPQTQMMIAPKGMPADRVKIVHDAVKQVLEDPEFQAMLAKTNVEILYKSGATCLQEIVDLKKTLSSFIYELFPEFKKTLKK